MLKKTLQYQIDFEDIFLGKNTLWNRGMFLDKYENDMTE